MDEPEPQVIAAARGGDLGAFEDLVRRYQPTVWRLCFHLLRDEAMTDDATQDSFVRVYRFLPRYRGQAKFSTWLFAITRNCALDELRRVGRRNRLSEALHLDVAQPASDSTVRVEIHEALGELPLELREPVVFIDMFGASYSEVARVLGVPVGTVKSRVHRARRILADVLLDQKEEKNAEG